MEAAHVSVAAVSSTVMAGAYGMLPVIGGVMTMAMACVMVMLMLLTQEPHLKPLFYDSVFKCDCILEFPGES